MVKRYSVEYRHGTRNRHAVSFHDGVATHSDGSPFYDRRTFRNLRDRDAFMAALQSDGYTMRSFSEYPKTTLHQAPCLHCGR